MSVKVTAENFDAEIKNGAGVVIADFYSDSCIPCKRMSPLLAEIEEEFPDIKLCKINVNFDAELAAEYDVTAAPTLIYFTDGNEAERTVGAVKKSDIIEIINKIKGE